ncbi:MAG: hypothetical protein ACK57T_15435 [Dolichospermum sp.]
MIFDSFRGVVIQDSVSINSVFLPVFPVPCSLFPVPCSLFPVTCSLFPVPCNLFPDHTSTYMYLSQIQ